MLQVPVIVSPARLSPISMVVESTPFKSSSFCANSQSLKPNSWSRLTCKGFKKSLFVEPNSQPAVVATLLATDAEQTGAAPAGPVQARIAATATTAEPTVMLTLPRPGLEPRLHAVPALAARFYRALALLVSRRLRVSMGTFGQWLQPGSEEDPASPFWPEVGNDFDRFRRLAQEAASAGATASAAESLTGRAQQAFAALGLNYVLETYLPEKLKKPKLMLP